MIEITTKKGLIAFFDILGYQQILLSNEVQKTAELIVDVLAKVPNEIVRLVTEPDLGLIINENLKTSQFQGEMYKKIIEEELGWLLFSDSILVSLPVDFDDPNEPLYFKGLRWTAFLYVCTFLQRLMFDKGLPLRGAISYGDFFIEENYFAGKPIIESYQASESLELSGCIMARSSERLYHEFYNYAAENNYASYLLLLHQLVVPYLVPLKKGKMEKAQLLNWINLPLTPFKNLPTDIREYVFSAFVDYNRDAAPIVYPKINNTEAFIRKVLKNIESKPWPVMSEKQDALLQSLLKEKNIPF